MCINSIITTPKYEGLTLNTCNLEPYTYTELVLLLREGMARVEDTINILKINTHTHTHTSDVIDDDNDDDDDDGDDGDDGDGDDDKSTSQLICIKFKIDISIKLRRYQRNC